MSENDAQLELKKRARRRLVGAIALAILAAIILPMVMDQAPKQPVQDINIRIPAQDAGAFTSRILPVKPGAVPTPLPPAAVPESKSAEPAKPSPAKQELKPEPAREPKKAEQKVPPAKADAQASTTPSPAASSGEEWIVQLGAYRDQDNIRNLTAKLRQQGYNFYTEVLPSPDGISKTRVRAGPFPSKEKAEAARERIKRIGVDGVVAQK